MKNLSDSEKWKLLAKEDVNQAASDFCRQPTDIAANMADELGGAYMVNVISQLGSDAAADLLRNLPEDFRRQVMAELTEERRLDLAEILSHKAGTAGAMMAKEYLSVPAHYNIHEATEYLQSLPAEKKGKVSYIYVVDENRRLAGVIQIRDLVFYPSDKPIQDILRPGVVQVETAMSQMDVARLLQRHRYLGLPVVDAGQRLVGVISADNAMQAFEEEASDDIAKMAGTTTEEIRTHSVRRIVRIRMPWLCVNIASGFLCALITGFFENNLETVATLFLFVPMVLGLSESTGVQSATIVVRNLTLGHTRFSALGALFLRETFAAIFIGAICGGIVGLIAYLWKSMPHAGVALACSMSLAMIISALIGLSLPLIFKRFKIDPAIASGPLVLAICDLQTLLVYFSLSSRILAA